MSHIFRSALVMLDTMHVIQFLENKIGRLIGLNEGGW
jgi:hypothetical protein